MKIISYFLAAICFVLGGVYIEGYAHTLKLGQLAIGVSLAGFGFISCWTTKESG